MSDHIPFHIQREIMKRLPVKSLVQFRCVSKPWKSLIDSSEFVSAHTLRRHTQPHHLLVSDENPFEGDDLVLFSRCFIDDDTFPQQRYVPTLPVSVKQLMLPRVVGSSQGLLCLYGHNPTFTTQLAVLWNPSIRKSIVVREPSVGFDVCHATGYTTEPSVGFGVCPVNSDPKIVAITQSNVMVYTLSSGKWRRLSSKVPAKPIGGLSADSHSVVTDRFIYWDVELHDRKMIMSFDLTSESFEVIDLPDCLARYDDGLVQTLKVRESLALLQYGNLSTAVWMLDHGARRLFTKLYTITTPHDSIVGFRKNGMPIMKVRDDDDSEHTKLVVYEPNSERNNAVEVSNLPIYFNVYPYMETLLLLGRSGCRGY